MTAALPRPGRNDRCPCGSGKKVKRCHEQYLKTPSVSPMFPTDDELFTTIERGLAEFPHLKASVPAGYPRSGSARIEPEKARIYESTRTSVFSQNYNLPLLLHLIGSPVALPHAQAFARQIGGDAEAFIAQFGTLPGAKKVIAPLWKAPWDVNDPSLWSVVSHCHLAQRYGAKPGGHVVGFEVPTGTGNKTADIEVATKDERFLIDIEMWHAASGDRPEVIGQRAIARAQRKARDKFGDLPEGTVGVVVEVCFAEGPTFGLVHQNQSLFDLVDLPDPPRAVAQLMAIAGIGGKDRRINSYAILDFWSPRLPLLPTLD